MTALIVLTCLSLAGIGTAFWLLKNSQEPEEDSLSEALNIAEETGRPSKKEISRPVSDGKQKSSILKRLTAIKGGNAESANMDTDEPAEIPSEPKKPLSFLTGLLEMLHLTDILKKLNIGGKDSESENIPETTPLPSLKEYFENESKNAPSDEPETGTASLKTIPAEEPAEKHPLPETATQEDTQEKLALSSQLDELQMKYEKLDVLFNEKSAELQKTKESLDNEIKNREEFNKVKKLLEQEIRDSKDRTRNVQAEGEDAKSEIERHEKMTSQLEEKIAQMEKDLVEKEDKISDLLKRLQTFASPSTAATPPTFEKDKAEGYFIDTHQDLSDHKDENTQEEAPQHNTENPPQTEEPPKDDMQKNDEEEGPVEEAPSEEILKDIGGANQDDVTTKASSPFETEPPEPYEEPSPDVEPQEKISFLKLQPDVVSDESEKDSSIASEIEQSLEAPPEREIKSDPGQSITPKTDPKNQEPFESTDEEINKTLDAQQYPEPQPSNQEQKPETNDNTDHTKE
ncbi:MAG: hypothetical protein KAS66_13760 [Candidatus Omnitrophica bacterium]|nr:hypothetical protein [Candidatus Omnitrophota bacterium]